MLKRSSRKTIAVLLLSGMLMGVIPTASMASDANGIVGQEIAYSGIAPRMTYIVEWKTSLTISNGTATVDCWVNGDVLDATKAKVIAELQVKSGKNWIAYGTWVDTQTDYEAAVYETKAVKKGNTYRVKATYTVWEGSASENLIVFSDEITA